MKRMIHSYKAFLFDVDDTVMKSNQVISDEMASVLNAIPAEIGFISGTDVKELERMISAKLNRRHHILGNVGTHYVIRENGVEKEVWIEKLSVEEKQEIIEAVIKLKERYNLQSMTTEEDQILDRGSAISFAVLGRHAPSDRKANYDKDKKKRLEFIAFLAPMLGKKYQLNIGGTTSIDITLKGRDKGRAITLFLKENNMKPDEVIFFGDHLEPGGNDYEAIKSGVRCVAVQNPDDTLQKLRTMQF